MSRRRKPDEDLSHLGIRPKVQLVCTGRGAHKRTHLGWVDLSRADERPRDTSDPGDDWLFFTIDKRDDVAVGLEDHARETIDMDTGEIHRGDDRSNNLLNHIRVRFTPMRLCDRCSGDTQLTEARLALIVGRAQDDGMSSLDISRLR